MLIHRGKTKYANEHSTHTHTHVRRRCDATDVLFGVFCKFSGLIMLDFMLWWLASAKESAMKLRQTHNHTKVGGSSVVDAERDWVVFMYFLQECERIAR